MLWRVSHTCSSSARGSRSAATYITRRCSRHAIPQSNIIILTSVHGWLQEPGKSVAIDVAIRLITSLEITPCVLELSNDPMEDSSRDAKIEKDVSTEAARP